jgi:hypothetical protein
MALFTKGQFFNLTQLKAGSRDFGTILNESRRLNRQAQTTSIFLSHAHSDKSFIERAVAFFRTMNIQIYVDWMDETMPQKPNGVTAQNIKSKILSNDKFILLATDAAVSSKWCNWEVGIGDAFKLHQDKICLLPLAENSGQWTGNEYLQVYPRIETVVREASFYDNIFKVKYPDGRETWLDQWLKK